MSEESKPSAPPPEKGECPGDGTGRTFKHYWRWWWEDPERPEGVWPEKSICSTCGKVEIPRRFSGQ